MKKRRCGYRGSRGCGNGGGFSGKVGKTLVRQIIVCLIIVLAAIAVKKMDHAMTDKALNAVQTFMAKDYSNMEIIDSAKSVFARIGSLPASVETAVESGRRKMEFMEPSNEEALVMTFGGQSESNAEDQAYEGMKYSSEKELQVYAASGGTVISVEGEEGTRRIRLSHGGELETQYAGCTAVYVKPLEKVKKGQLIASITPGDQQCLTFSMWKGRETINPADYIEF